MGKCKVSGGLFETTARVGGGPTSWFPNSRFKIRCPIKGDIHTWRWFDYKGIVIWDRHWRHGGRGPFPHDHEWIDGVKQDDHLEGNLEIC